MINITLKQLHITNDVLLQGIDSTSHPVLLISRNTYIRLSAGDFAVYCLQSEAYRIKACINEVSRLEAIEIAKILQRMLRRGVYVLVKNSVIIMGTPLFDDFLAWSESSEELVISDSVCDIAAFCDLSLSVPALAVNLTSSLPYYPFHQIPLWNNVNTLRVYCVLRRNATGNLVEIETWEPPSLNYDIKAVYSDIRERLLLMLSEYAKRYSKVSLDISGGVDSVSIVYLLKALHAKFNLYHAETDSSWNSDSKWTRLIANDIGQTFTALPSVGESGRKFELNHEYFGSILPDSPVYWSDTEGYVDSIAHLTRQHDETIHFTGLGGDELFAPMPSHAWSLVRQNRVRSMMIAFQYCMLTRTPISVGIRELVDRTPFNQAVKVRIDMEFNNAESHQWNSTLNWCGPVAAPAWFTQLCREMVCGTAEKTLKSVPSALDADRSRHQTIESILFQRRIISQLNRVYGSNGMIWDAPFTDPDVVTAALSIPARYRQNPSLTKPILYQATKGIVPREVFTRGVKGDYSAGLYKSYREAIATLREQARNLILVELGLIDPDRLISELSMPTAVGDRIEAFARLAAVERWVRNAMSYKQCRFERTG